jgi:ribosome-associated protein
MEPIVVRVKQNPPIAIAIQTAFIRLDAFLKLAGAVESGGQAKTEIQGGFVRLNNTVCEQRGKKILPGDVVRYAGQTYLAAAAEEAG